MPPCRTEVHFCCTGNSIPLFFSTTDQDGGQEFGPIYGTINMARAPGLGAPIVWRGGPNLIIATWWGWGRPHRLALPGFDLVTGRTSTNIWHKVEIWMWCSGGRGVHRIVTFDGSRFPTHALWVNGGVRKRTLIQGALSDLWTPMAGMPTFVK